MHRKLKLKKVTLKVKGTELGFENGGYDVVVCIY